jgi:hypothetical protein
MGLCISQHVRVHMTISGESYRNRLLDALASAERARLSPELEAIEMPAGFVIYDADSAGGRVFHDP